MIGHYQTFESDLRDLLVEAGFVEQRLHPDIERYTLQTDGGFFSAVPWEILSPHNYPMIWLAEVNSKHDIYANDADHIADFIAQFNPIPATAP